jgi:hypothetical protein
MTIFTWAPVELSKHVFDLFIWENSNELCLLRLITKCLQHVEERCLTMSEKQVMDFIIKGEFIKVSFEEIPLNQLFLDE